MPFLAEQQHAIPTDPEAGAMPRHVAIIMDGNGRWATERGLPRGEGHRRGVEAVRRTVRAALDLGVRHLTLYSFSSENWTRPRDEVDFLFGLFRLYIRRDVAELHEQGVRISMIGSREGVPADMLDLIDEAKARTGANRKLHLVLAFNYGARNEIARAARRIADDAKAGRLDPSSVTEATIANYLDTADYPDPDLVIRTGREMRLSNFLLWQSAYAELVFLKVNWPDFGRDSLVEAIGEFGTRTRRYGGHGAREGA